MLGPLNKTIFVGNLTFSTSEEGLRELFAPFGEVLVVHLVRHRESGESRGFGFVKMSRLEAEAAMEALDGEILDGRAIRVSEAQPRHARESGFGNKGMG